MRASITRYGEMPGPQRAWNVWWGDKHGLIKQRGVYQYTISPFQAKAAPHWARDYLFNGFRRLSGEAVYWVIPFAMGYSLYTWANKYTEYHESKAGHLAAMASGEHEGH